MRNIPILAFLMISAILPAGCSISASMGELPTAEEEARFAGLANYKDGQFINREPAVIKMPTGPPSRWRMLRHFLSADTAPDRPLPLFKPGHDTFAEKSAELKVIWLGHSSLLIELDRVRFMVDPVFGNASPVPGTARRYSPPPFTRQDLPHLDFVLITHDHYDHLEYDTVRHLRHSDVRFVVPLGAGARLRGWGIDPFRIFEMNWEESVELHGLRITAQTARHFSGRTFEDRNKTLWTSYVVEGANRKIFLAGDGGYGGHFKEIGDKFGPFDLVCLEIDAWNERWHNHHLFPEEVTTAFHDLRGKLLLPVHWAVFNLGNHYWDRSIRRLAFLADEMDVPLITPVMGQPVIPGRTPTTHWWLEMSGNSNDEN